MDEEHGTYTDGPQDTLNNLSYQRTHTIGAVVSALAASGLRIEFLRERDWTLFQHFKALVKDEDGYHQPEGVPRAPLMYSLRASHPV